MGCATKTPPISYKTPEDTFLTWKRAAQQLDIDLLIQSYASSARPSVEQDLKRTTVDELNKMSREAKQTQFQIERVVFESNTAYLRVKRKFDRMVDIEVVTMVKEGENWKLLP